MTQAEIINIGESPSPKPQNAQPKVPKTSNNLPDVFVGARRLLKNTPWMSPMGLGFVSAAVLLLPAISIWSMYIYGNKNKTKTWTEILSEAPGLFEGFRWSLIAGLFAFSFFMALTMFTLAPLATKYSKFLSIRRMGQVVGVARHNLAFFVASFIVLIGYLNWGLNVPVDEVIAEAAKLRIEAIRNAARNEGKTPDILVGVFSTYLNSVLELITEKRDKFKFIPYVIFLLSFSLLIEKFVILYISHNFHKSFYTKRIRRNNMVLSCFETLSIRFHPANHRPIRSGAVLKNEAIDMYAETIFNGLLKPDRRTLIVDDFLDEIDHPIAVDLFKYLDFNQSNDVSVVEFKEAIHEAYEEKRVLLKSIKANENVIARIDKFFVTVILLVKLSTLLPKMNIDFLTVLGYVGISSFFLRILMDHFIKQLFNSAMHFLVTHPYDVGDKIQMENRNYRIKDMGFWKTTLISSDGKISYIPNYTLFSVKFGNYRRSDKMESNISMNLPVETSKKAIEKFTSAINEFIKEKGKYFDDHVVIKDVQILHADCLTIVFGVMHKFNFNNEENLHHRCSLIFKNMTRIAQEQNLPYSSLRFLEE